MKRHLKQENRRFSLGSQWRVVSFVWKYLELREWVLLHDRLVVRPEVVRIMVRIVVRIMVRIVVRIVVRILVRIALPYLNTSAPVRLTPT